MKKKPAYQSPFAEWPTNNDHYDRLPLANLQFIFKEAETRLKFSLDAGDSLRTKAYNFISVLLVLFSSIGAFTISKLKNFMDDPALVITGIASLIYLFCVARYLLGVVRPKKQHVLGMDPAKILTRDVAAIKQGDKEDSALKFLIFNQISHYDKRIHESVDANDQKGAIINNSIDSLLLFPLIMLGLYLVILGLSSPSQCLQ